ncbi:related to sexual differentiation process protein isp4 [Phialocephala subalpina]|uniref:Related to sexual differentiation process protein isp4 n=1 Tax=Phialocephala subalpina TaxID=576137 RepID=A0A1L7WUY0_9HELO|nr:related to sexual differentiation process protein isp4 [Phialocephala subalpina]
MSSIPIEKHPAVEDFTEKLTHDISKEKIGDTSCETALDVSLDQIEADLNVTEDDLLEAKEHAKDLSLEETRQMMIKVLKVHEKDPNFSVLVLDKINEFLGNPDVFEHPEKHADLIYEMKTEAALITNNSPYAEVRAVVDNTDDVNMPSSTIRAWVIGLLFVVALAFINQLFSIRQPQITVLANVAQLLCYPVGKAAEALLPDWGFTIFGSRHSLNPGKFSTKEHMLITIMASVGYSTPYTDNIIWSQYLPQYFNQSYAGHFGYQILIALSTNFIGYGIAGICRRFLVYPAYCVWPASLVTIALNDAFHTEKNISVPGPLKRMFTTSRLRFFCYAFAAMFVWFWFPDYLFQVLSIFNWMSWIAPNNTNLNTVVGFNNGVGINPLPTFDWNVLLWDSPPQDPLVVPFFNTINKFVGSFFSAFVVLGIWYTNTYHTGYLPVNSNRVFDHFGDLFNVSRAINEKGLFDAEKYEAYSPAYLSAGYATLYLFFFAIYTATISYAYLYHRHEIAMGFRNLFNSFRKNKDTEYEYTDVHNRLMAAYPEVPEWWYLITLVFAIALGCAAIGGWETYTTVGVVFYGIALCLVFVIPIGIIKAITGLEVTLNVLAEFIGGSWAEGNALAMNFFKSYGYVTCSHALRFANDLKLAHYVKVPPKHTFWAQMIATIVSSLVCTGVLNFQMNQIEGVCTTTQKDHYTCPGINQFFTAAVLWGTIGPKKVFGKGGQYSALLVGFPLGLVLPFVVYWFQRKFPRQSWLRQVHVVAIMYGAITWAPYNVSYTWPAVPIAWLSMIYFKRRFLPFWSKYNYVLSAAFSSAIAIAAIIIFFGLQWTETSVDWWGNDVSYQGCEGTPCLRFTLPEGEYFGPKVGDFH